MSKKNKKPKKTYPSSPKDNGGEQDRDLKPSGQLRGIVEVQFSHSLVEKYDREHQRSKTKEQLEKAALWITLFAVLLTAIGTIWQAKLTKNAMQVDQRATIQVTWQNPHFVDNQQAVFAVRIANIGKTVARQLDGHIDIYPIKTSEGINFTDRPGIGHPRYKFDAGIVFPNAPLDVPFPMAQRISPPANIAPLMVTPELHRAIDNGEVTIVIHGEFSYLDVWDNKHWVRFCGYTLSGPLPLTYAVVASEKCSAYNAIDHN